MHETIVAKAVTNIESMTNVLFIDTFLSLLLRLQKYTFFFTCRLFSKK